MEQTLLLYFVLNPNKNKMTRRNFLKKTALATLATLIPYQS